MLLLIRNIPLHRILGRCTHRKCRIPLLPMKAAKMRFPDPRRRRFLQLAHKIRQTMSRLQRHQKMNMIHHPSNSLRKRIEPFRNPTKISVQLLTPTLLDNRFPILRRENHVIMQARMGRWHSNKSMAPHPGCRFREILIRWCRCAQPPATRLNASSISVTQSPRPK